jgi:hypothetical protein
MPGILAVNNTCSVQLYATSKDGKLTSPGFVQQSVAAASKCAVQPLQVGSKVSLTLSLLDLKNNNLVFVIKDCGSNVCTDATTTFDKAQVNFEFTKGSLEMANIDQVVDIIGRVFAIDSVSKATSAVAENAIPRPTSTALADGMAPIYVSAQNRNDRLQLNSDNSFSLEESGQPFNGTYTIAGATLTLKISELQRDVDIQIANLQLIVNGNEIWIPAEPTADRSNQGPIRSNGVSNSQNATPTSEQLADAVRVFLDDLKMKAALNQDAIIIPTSVIPTSFDLKAGTTAIANAATAIFQMRSATYLCGVADSGPKGKSTRGSAMYTVEAKLRRTDAQHWTIEEIKISGRDCSPVWPTQISIR